MTIFKKLNIKLCCFVIYSLFGIYSCQTDTNETNLTIDDYTIIGKWNILKNNYNNIDTIKLDTIKPKLDTTTIRLATSYYKTIEFLPSGDYLLINIDSTKINPTLETYFFNKYVVNTDQTISLNISDSTIELATLKVKDKSLNFDILGIANKFSATKAEQFPLNISNDLLCRKWKEEKVNGQTLIFSKSGTFIISNLKIKDTYIISDWKWKSEDRIIIVDYGVISDLKYTIDKLTYKDKDGAPKSFVLSTD